MPFSKRADDSLRKWNCLAERRIEIGSNSAASNATVVVSGTISESRPPITPAKAIGFSPLVITSDSGDKTRVSPSRVNNSSLSVA